MQLCCFCQGFCSLFVVFCFPYCLCQTIVLKAFLGLDNKFVSICIYLSICRAHNLLILNSI